MCKPLSYYVHSPYISKVNAGSVRVSVIHRTLTWTTGSLPCLRDHSYACVYKRGFGTPTTSQFNIFDSETFTHLVILKISVPNQGMLLVLSLFQNNLFLIPVAFLDIFLAAIDQTRSWNQVLFSLCVSLAFNTCFS